MEMFSRWAPSPAINGVITPINKVITLVTHLQGKLGKVVSRSINKDHSGTSRH